MTIFFATVALIYAASLCFVIVLFAHTLRQERSTPVDTTGTVLELSPTQAIEKSRADAAAKTA